MTTGPLPAGLVNAIKATNAAPASEDRLLKVRDAIREARDLEQVKKDQEEALSKTNEALTELYYNKLPDIFDEARIPALTLAAEGNHPEIKAECSPYYHANIAVDWEEERRSDAFKYLDDIGHGGLIKAEVTVLLPRPKKSDEAESREKLKKLVALAEELDVAISVKEAVPWNTLTAWLKDQVSKKGFTPDLEKIGGKIGRVVKLKAMKTE